MLKLPLSVEGSPIDQGVLSHSGQVSALKARVFEEPFPLLFEVHRP